MGRSSKKQKVEKEPSEGPSQSSSPELDSEISSSKEHQEASVATGGISDPEAARTTDDFEARYLQHITSEFADDLDKLRNASDFTEDSLPILIDALKRSGKVYTEEEQRILMGKQE